MQAIDPLIDANGRSVGVRGCIDNRQGQLRPGMFARVNAVFGERENARVVPEEAIIPQGGKQFVIKLLPGPTEKTRIANRVEVKVGLRRPGRVEILEGLEPGDTVVTAGQQRLQKDGLTVTVVDMSSARGGAGSGAGPARTAASGASAAPTAPAVSTASAPAGPNPCDASLAKGGAPSVKSAPAGARKPA